MGCTDSRRTRLVTQCEPCTVASEMLKACLLLQNDLITADGGEMTTDCEEGCMCKPEYPRVATGSCDLCSLAGSPKSSLVLFFVHCFRPPHSLSDKKLSNISCHYPFLFRIHLHYAQAQRFTITLSRMFKNVLIALTIPALALAAAVPDRKGSSQLSCVQYQYTAPFNAFGQSSSGFTFPHGD